jgi:hypothetical protein
MTAYLEVILSRRWSFCPRRERYAFGFTRFLRIEPPHLHAMGVVHEPVEDVIGQRRIAACSCQRETCSCEAGSLERTW